LVSGKPQRLLPACSHHNALRQDYRSILERRRRMPKQPAADDQGKITSASQRLGKAAKRAVLREVAAQNLAGFDALLFVSGARLHWESQLRSEQHQVEANRQTTGRGMGKALHHIPVSMTFVKKIAISVQRIWSSATFFTTGSRRTLSRRPN